MTKAQIVGLLLVGITAGAGGRSLLSLTSSDGTELIVQSVGAGSARLPDGGSVLVVETCGLVRKPGQGIARWCDQRADPRMDGLVTDSVKWLEEARQAGELRQSVVAKQISELRKAPPRRDAGR